MDFLLSKLWLHPPREGLQDCELVDFHVEARVGMAPPRSNDHPRLMITASLVRVPTRPVGSRCRGFGVA